MTAAPDRRLEDALDAAAARARALAPRLPALAALVCAVGVGLTAADLVWSVHALRAPPPAAMVAPPAPTLAVDPGAAADRLATVAAFGQPAAPADDGAEAPDSQLALTLRGVIAAGDAAYSRAFIADGSGQERGYPVGAALPGGATLQSVHPDRAVLARNGALETLRLPRDAAGLGPTAAPQPVEAEEVRSAQANPSRLLDWMRPVVATESNTGRQLGYRVYPGRDPDRFTKLGLQPGDLVTAVNGQPLDDPSRSMELMRSLTGSDNITLTVERDGAQRLVQIPVLQ